MAEREHKDRPFYIMEDINSPMKSDWPNNIKKAEEKKELELTDGTTEEKVNE